MYEKKSEKKKNEKKEGDLLISLGKDQNLGLRW
jgi:hypothetical protein